MKTSKLFLSLFCFTLLFMNTQCDDDDVVQDSCGQTVIIDSGFYDTAESAFYDLIDAEIQDNCLSINISASGCDGNSWSMVFVDSGSVAESSPEQRYLKFVFTNEEECLAIFTKERSFDLSSLQVSGSNEIILNIEDFPEPLNYTY